MGAQISTNLSSCCSSNIKSKADLGRYIKSANKSTLMVINFTTTWCQPCKDAEPPMRKLAEEFPDVKFARVDIDLLKDVVTEFDLKTMPTFLLCKKVDDGLDKGKGDAEVGGGNGSANRISSANNVNEGNSLVPSAREGKIADSIKEGNRAAGGATGTGVELANSAAVSGSKGERTTANAKEGQRMAPTPNGENATSNVKEGNSVPKIESMKNGDGVTGVKEGNSVPSLKRRTLNYAGKKVFIDEIDRMEGPLALEGHELRKKIEYYMSFEKEIIPASFKSTDEFNSYLEKSKPTQLMVINLTTERSEPCKKADETFKKLSKVYKDVKFANVDVDVLKNTAEEFDATMMPTLPAFLLVKVKKLEKEHVKKDGVQGDHKRKKEPPEKEHVKKDGVHGDHKGKKEPPEKEHVKKDGVQGDHKEKKEPPEKELVKKDGVHVKIVVLGRLVGWDNKKEGELSGMIEKHRYTTT